MPYETIKERVTGELKRMFRPEFLNRVDEVIVFHDLTHDEIMSIVDLMVARLRDQLFSQGLGISLTPEARELLAKAGFDPTLGARPLRRAIQRLVEDPLSEQLLSGEWKPGEVVELAVDGGVIVFRKGSGPVIDPGESVVAAGTVAKATMPPRGKSSSSRGPVAGGAAD